MRTQRDQCDDDGAILITFMVIALFSGMVGVVCGWIVSRWV